MLTKSAFTSASDPARVLVHGFGEYAILYHHLIVMAAKEAPHLAFAAILPTSHHLAVLQQAVPVERILCLECVLRPQPTHVSDLSILASYSGSIHADIEAEKRTFKSRPSAFQLARAVEIYERYRKFVLDFKPHHILLSHVESYEQKMLESLARELCIPVSVPTDLRTIGGSFMAPDTQETLPPPGPITDDIRRRAEELIANFRKAHLSALKFPIPEGERGASLDLHTPPLAKRTFEFVRRVLRHPDQFEWDYLRAAILNNMKPIRDTWWNLKTKRAAREFDIATVDQLPQKFVYYPLHLTPESSINTPAPYYVDQFRVVDAIRMAMPSDHHLVVKEHYASIMVRPIGFMRQLRKRSGVTVIHYKTPGRELVKRAALTISVTGTSTLEAFLLGKSALTLGGMFLSRHLGGVVHLSELHDRIIKAIATPPSDQHIAKSIMEIMATSRPFTIFHVNQPGNPTHSEGNIRNLLSALQEQIVIRSKGWESQSNA